MGRAADLGRGSQRSSRREALRRGSIAAAALAAGAGIGLGKRPASAAAAVPSQAQDREIFNFALLLEYLQAAFYSEATRGATLRGEVRRFAESSQSTRTHTLRSCAMRSVRMPARARGSTSATRRGMSAVF